MTEIKTIGDSNHEFNIIEFENYIFPEILKMKKKYPNDQDFGKHVRRLLTLNNQKKV
jgi:hypothetical protein